MATSRTVSGELKITSEKKHLNFQYSESDLKVVGNAQIAEDATQLFGIRLETFSGDVRVMVSGNEKQIANFNTNSSMGTINMNINDPNFANRGSQIYQLCYDAMSAIVTRYTVPAVE